MTTDADKGSLLAEDYQAIEDAVMETARGRWFLGEYARRHRVVETDAIVATLERLEKTIKRDRQVPDIDRIRLDLADMAEAIFRTKQEIAQMKLETDGGGRFSIASNELDAIVSQTEEATNDILLNAEQIQEMAWTLREHGVESALCDRLDQHATEIYTSCSFQDLTGQRTRKVVTVLRYLESRIHSMIGIWGLESLDEAEVVATPLWSEDTRPDAHLLNGPALAGAGIDQSSIDDLLDRPAEDDSEVPLLAEDRVAADETATPRRPISSADFTTGARRAHEPIDDDLPLVAPGLAMADSVGADVFAAAPEPVAPPLHGQAAIDDLFDSLPDAPNVFAASAALPATEDPEAEESAPDVFVAAPAAAPKPVARPAPRTVVVGNTVMAIAADVAVAVAAEPELALVPQDDPIAALSEAERLVAFG